MKSEWRVMEIHGAGGLNSRATFYGVYRLKDAKGPDEAGNREQKYDLFTKREDAEKFARIRNEAESGRRRR